MTAPHLQACLNGSRRAAEHPSLPVTADELAAEAARAWMAGAHGVHVHPRDAEGHETLAPGFCAEAVAAIRVAAPQLEISLSTGAFIEPDLGRRMNCVQAWTVLPDCASVNLAEPGAAALCVALHHRGVPVEAGLASVADAERFAGSDLARRCRRVLIEVGDTDPAAAVAHAARIDAVLDEAMIVLPRCHHGEGRATWAVVVAAARAGCDLRIGLEDTLVLPDGSPRPATRRWCAPPASCSAERLSGGPESPTRASRHGSADAYVEVVVVVHERLDDPRRSRQIQARTHEDMRGTRRGERVDQLLGQQPVDQPGLMRAALAPVPAWVVDVDVEPVLVRRVSQVAETRPEVSAARPRQVADPHARRVRVGGAVATQAVEQEADQAVGAPAAPGAVG